MADFYINTDETISAAVSRGLSDQDRIIINSGAVLTIDQTPTILFGRVNINEGELLLDGANASNPIVIVGAEQKEINVNGAGVLRSTLGWWEFPTTGDGTVNQTFDCSTYFSSSGSAISADVINGVWVETGRRINYNSGSGIAPLEGDWVFKSSDTDVMGRIVSVVGTETSGYMVVRFLTGSLADGDQIELHTIQDNKGPDYQKSWFGNVVGADVLEPDVFQEFGNCFQNNTDYLSQAGSGMAGFVFSNPFQSNTLTFGDGTNGFIVPNGARVKMPMVHIATATAVDYAAGNSSWITGLHNTYEIETANGGDCFLSGVSIGSAHWEDNLGNEFQASYCTAHSGFGVYGALQRATYDHCIFVYAAVGVVSPASQSIPAIVDMINGADVRDCLGVYFSSANLTNQFGGQTSSKVNLERIIQIAGNSSHEFEMIRVTDFTAHDVVIIGSPMQFTTSTKGKVTLLKTQRDILGNVSGSDQIIITNSSTDVVIEGWEIIQGSCPDDTKYTVIDSSNLKVRGFHFIDDKFNNDQGAKGEGEEFASVNGFCSDIEIARCWQDNGTPDEFIFVTAGTVKNLSVLNSSSLYSGEVEPDGINTSFRGLHGGSGRLGATSGLETDFPGTSGAQFGDLFESDTTGYIYYRNTPGTLENPINILAGNPRFTKDGDVDVKAGDQWEVDMGYVALGHTSFTGVITTTRNGTQANEGVDVWTGVGIDFQYDVGAGFNGTWLDLRTPANLTAITGMVDGIRLKLRFTGVATQTNGQALSIHTTTSIADQAANLHPIDVEEYTLSLSGLKPNSEIRIYRKSDMEELAGVETSGTEFSYTYTYSSDIEVVIVIHALGFLAQRFDPFTLTNSNSSLPIQQVVDRQYMNP
jgi:hypothetical protein